MMTPTAAPVIKPANKAIEYDFEPLGIVTSHKKVAFNQRSPVARLTV
jgi:hypothetical protein